MRLLIDNALIYDDKAAGFRCGSFSAADGRVLPGGAEVEYDKTIDACGAHLIPGLVDIHTHGRAGFDFCDANCPDIATMAQSYLLSGVSSVVPTLASSPYEQLFCAADKINAARHKGGARLIGIHLEGRYLNPRKRGVQAEELLSGPECSELEELISRMRLPMHLTFAPELDADGIFLRRACELGATVAAGHTMMTYEEAVRAEQGGITAYSHLFNAMPSMHHRGGGAVCAALIGGAYCELICDGIHISPEMIKLAYRCLGSERTVLVSDSMAGAGCPDGEYVLAGVAVTVKDGIALSSDGTLGGSTLNLFDGMMNLMKFCDIDLGEAVACATINPARAVGIDDLVGSLEVGKYADALLLRQNGNGGYLIEQIIKGGEPV